MELFYLMPYPVSARTVDGAIKKKVVCARRCDTLEVRRQPNMGKAAQVSRRLERDRREAGLIRNVRPRLVRNCQEIGGNKGSNRRGGDKSTQRVATGCAKRLCEPTSGRRRIVVL
jgi:hypothetical protein